MATGFNTIFISGIMNLFAFGGIEILYFLPPNLKQPKSFKKITIVSILLSAIYLLISVSTILFMFTSFSQSNELMPLYTAVRYIEFGTFFQRLDSIFLLIWTISICCYISIILKFSMNIFGKLTNIKNSKMSLLPLSLLLLSLALLPKNLAISTFLESTVYKYAFFIVVIIISLTTLIIANLKYRKQRR